MTVLAATSTERINGLPTPLTPLVGREREIAALCQLLVQPHVRLVTLTGTGGVGKTRLALAASERLMGEFPDGVIFVPLQTVTDPGLVVSAIAQSLNVRETADRSLVDSTAETLRDEAMLLVLDNFEQVLPAAPIVARLLSACTQLTVLVTSRALLRLSGEQAFDVEPLPLPDLQRLPSVDELERIDSVRLFLTHARQARAGFSISPRNAADVAAICNRLDGLPLALELAAARVRILSTQALLARLDQRLRILTAGPRDVPSRQQTMRGAISWSYDLLSPAEQRLFQQLSVFVGGWTLDAAEAICDHAPDFLDSLSALVDHSLVGQTEQPDGTLRYWMLETIREFGVEQLEATGRAGVVCRRHAEYFLRTFEDAEVEWYGPDAAHWVALSETELGNLRSSLTWAVENDADIALRFIKVIGGCWETLGYYSEARRWTELALASPQPASPALRAYALFEAGFLATTQGDYSAGQAFSEEGYALYSSIGDSAGAAWCLYGMGRAAMWSGNFDRAAELYESTVSAARGVDDRLLCSVLGNLGAVYVVQQRDEQADRCLREAIDCAEAVNHIVGLGYIIPEYALLALQQGDPDAATERLKRALEIQQQLRDPRFASQAIEVAAWIAARKQQPLRVARLLGAASAIREAIGIRVPPMTQMCYDAYVPAAKALATAANWDRAWQEGRNLSLDAALAEALATDEETGASVARKVGLSPRELDVLRLLIEGRSNQEIGVALSISPHTAANHVTNIMNKLGVDSRTAAATWAVRNGI